MQMTLPRATSDEKPSSEVSRNALVKTAGQTKNYRYVGVWQAEHSMTALEHNAVWYVNIIVDLTLPLWMSLTVTFFITSPNTQRYVICKCKHMARLIRRFWLFPRNLRYSKSSASESFPLHAFQIHQSLIL